MSLLIAARADEATTFHPNCLRLHVIDPITLNKSIGKTKNAPKTSVENSLSATKGAYMLFRGLDGKVRPYKPGYYWLPPKTHFECVNGAVVKITRTGPMTPYLSDKIWHDLNPIPSDEMARIAASFHPDVREGGRSKGYSRISAPVTLEWADLDHFEFHWDPAILSGKGEISLQNGPGGRTLWRDSDVDLSKGSYETAALVQALREWHDDVAADVMAKITITPEQGNPEVVIFHLLSAEEGRHLTADLSWWEANSQDELRLLGRAAVFAKYGLIFESRREYAAAALLEPSDPMVTELVKELQ